MKVIFLDIDGVLVTSTYCQTIGEKLFNTLSPTCTLLLQKAVKKSRAKLVLSSSWRYSNELCDNLRKQLNKYNLKIFDKTQVKISGMRRDDEILQWLSTHKNISHWCAIDDDNYDMTKIENKLIKTSFHSGILPLHLTQILYHLI